MRIITSHLFTLILTAQRVLIGIGTNVTWRVGTQGSSTWLSVLAKDVMMNKQVFLLEGSGRLFKATVQMVDNTVILNYPSGAILMAVIWCYGSSGDLHLLQPNNAQNVMAEALRNLSRGAERLGDTCMIQNPDASI